MDKQKLILITMVILVVLLTSGCFKKTRNKEYSDKMIVSEINTIVKKYGRNDSKCEILKKGGIEWLVKSSNENKKYLSKMNDSDMVLSINFKGISEEKIKRPLEIYVIFEGYLHFNNTNIAEKITAISCIFQTGEPFDADSVLVTITKDEFKNLYQSVDKLNKNQQQIAKELGDKWLDENHYNRLKLEYNNNDKFRELLITQWNNSKLSYDKRFSANYNYAGNKLSIDKITRLSDDISSSQTIMSLQINETGFLYGAWDKNNNIWLYGETIGLKMYKYDGVSNWIEMEKGNNEIPYPIKMVISKKDR